MSDSLKAAALNLAAQLAPSDPDAHPRVKASRITTLAAFIVADLEKQLAEKAVEPAE